MECVSLVISIIALLCTIGVYFIHDRKLKKQEGIIGEFNIKEFEHIETKRKQANVIAEFQKTGVSKRELIINNNGESEARNIRIESEDIERDKHFFQILDSNLFPIKQLHPSSQISLKVILVGDVAPTYDVTVIWDDDFSNDRCLTSTIKCS